jgi:hypothetical protein
MLAFTDKVERIYHVQASEGKLILLDLWSDI